jgi:hypothetical protein
LFTVVSRWQLVCYSYWYRSQHIWYIYSRHCSHYPAAKKGHLHLFLSGKAKIFHRDQKFLKSECWGKWRDTTPYCTTKDEVAGGICLISVLQWAVIWTYFISPSNFNMYYSMTMWKVLSLSYIFCFTSSIHTYLKNVLAVTSVCNCWHIIFSYF